MNKQLIRPLTVIDHDGQRHEAGSEPFEVSDKQAQVLLGLGAAELVGFEPTEPVQGEPAQDEAGASIRKKR